MTHARSSRNRRRRSRRGGFTLIELLVVIAIIAVLAGVGLYAVMHIRGKARRQMGESLLSSIQMGLETYKSEMNDYPPSYLSDEWLGSVCLAEAMLGRLDAEPNGGNSTSWAAGFDGKDGDGFRVRQRGKVHGPYIDTNIETRRNADGWLELLDPEDNVILYYLYDLHVLANPDDDEYVDDHNIDGPADIKAYVAGRDQRKFILCTPGPDGKYGDTADDKDGEDDFTNFGEE